MDVVGVITIVIFFAAIAVGVATILVGVAKIVVACDNCEHCDSCDHINSRLLISSSKLWGCLSSAKGSHYNKQACRRYNLLSINPPCFDDPTYILGKHIVIASQLPSIMTIVIETLQAVALNGFRFQKRWAEI